MQVVLIVRLGRRIHTIYYTAFYAIRAIFVIVIFLIRVNFRSKIKNQRSKIKNKLKIKIKFEAKYKFAGYKPGILSPEAFFGARAEFFTLELAA